MTVKNKLSEDSILELIHGYFANDSDELLLGRGDDCALLNIDTNNSYIAVTTDIFLEDAHFKSNYFPPEAVGYKALAVNISDIYSMGGIPTSAQFALTIPSTISLEFLEKSLSSMANLMKEHKIILSGGDLTKGDKICFTITLMGQVDKEVKLFRNQGQVGDIVYVVGDFGLSKTALHLLEEDNPEKNNYPHALKAHFFPKMHRESALAIASFAKKYKTSSFSLMDLSDGLAQDLPRLVQQYGVDINFKLEDINEEIYRYCKEDEEKALEFAIMGGEDYALLGTCPKEHFKELSSICANIKQIGTIIESKALTYKGKILKLKGYDHFKSE